MGRQNTSSRKCSVCGGKGVLNILHTKRRCLNCYNEYDGIRIDKDRVIYPLSVTRSKCHFCMAVSVIEEMESVLVYCSNCSGTGVRTWVDKIIRPYKRSRFENELLRTVLQKG